jgi:hypothetical protein
MSCTSKQNDPIEGQVIQPIVVKRFDTAFFAMDTNHISQGIAELYKNYPNFSSDFFNKLLQVDAINDTPKIKRFFRVYSPIFNNVIKLNAPKQIDAELNKTLARFHYYFPDYRMPKELVYYVSPLLTYFNVLNDSCLGVGLQISTFDHYTNQQIPFYCLQNLVDDYLSTNKTPNNLLFQMIESGKKQYIIKNISLNTVDTLLWDYSSVQLKAVQEQESAIWQYLNSEKMLMSKDRMDILNILGDAEHNSILGAPLPGNIGKYIGFRIVEAYMKKQPRARFEDLQKLAKTAPSIIYAAANYQP